MKTFAAICIGSYELELKIFELKKNGQKEIYCARQRLDLGRDSFRFGTISSEMVKRLCDSVKKFLETTCEYQVDCIRACATTAIREAENMPIVLEQIRLQTNLEVELLSNSEQRFLGYKAIALREDEFAAMIRKGTAVIETGSGSLQISLFHDGKLKATQNILLGALRLKERLERSDYTNAQFESFVNEMAAYRLGEFKRYYLNEYDIEHVIIFGEGARAFLYSNEEVINGMIDTQAFLKQCLALQEMPEDTIENRLGGAENSTMLIATAIIYRNFVTMTKAQKVWIPGIDLNDGLCYEYMQEKKLLKIEHDFESDILTAAWNMAERYKCDKKHSKLVMAASLMLFDELKKRHGLSKRDRLLLQIAAILQDCGKFMSLVKASKCTYNIIMASELIGLSHRERELVARIIRQSAAGREPMISIAAEEIETRKIMSRGEEMMQDYLKIRKLAALLCIADALDISHCQKYTTLKIKQEKDELKLTVVTGKDYRLEKNLFHEAAKQFVEIYQIKPVLIWKKE